MNTPCAAPSRSTPRSPSSTAPPATRAWPRSRPRTRSTPPTPAGDRAGRDGSAPTWSWSAPRRPWSPGWPTRSAPRASPASARRGEAAQIEGSKAFAKDVMTAAGVPTARARACVTPEEAAAALDEFGAPYVVKDDGLAAGKGVVVTDDREEALAHAAACERVVIEEFLDGPEVSLFALCDGTTAVPLQPAQDFKRAYDGDEGPNTGGMGAYTPLPWAPDGLTEQVMREVLQPTIDELARRGMPYPGVLYAGLALTSQGPAGDRVQRPLRRPGDPGGARPAGDAAGRACCSPARPARSTSSGPLRCRDGAAVTVVVAAENYPADPGQGRPRSTGLADPVERRLRPARRHRAGRRRPVRVRRRAGAQRGRHRPRRRRRPARAPTSWSLASGCAARTTAPTSPDEAPCTPARSRDLYQTDDGLLLMVASDRISAFDYVLEPAIPDKGADPHAAVAVVVRPARRPRAQHVTSIDVPAEVPDCAVMLCRRLDDGARSSAWRAAT